MNPRILSPACPPDLVANYFDAIKRFRDLSFDETDLGAKQASSLRNLFAPILGRTKVQFILKICVLARETFVLDIDDFA